MKVRVSIATSALLLAPTFATVAAYAQSDNGKYAETAFNEGRSYFENGNTAAACAKFQKSLDLDFQRTTLQALSVCREKEEKWASAWNNYLELARRFSQAGDEDKARLARSKASELEKKLLYIVLVMDAPPPGLDITVDGTKLDASLLGTRLPVDPGQHEVVVTAKKKKPWKQMVSVGPSPVEQQVKIAPLEDDPNADAAASSAQYQMPGPMRAAPGFWTTQRIIGASVGGAGIVALGGAAVFQIIALSEDSKRIDFENNATLARSQGGVFNNAKGEPISEAAWTKSADSRRDAAKNNQIGAIVLASAGGAMVITGIVLVVTGGSHRGATAFKPASKGLFADFSLTPTLSSRGLGALGTF